MSADASRNEVAQQPPADDLDLSGFPDGGAAPSDMFRAHLPQFGPWFFGSHERGRFNLELPDGTCYFADEFATAVREYFGPRVVRNVLTEEDAADVRVTLVHPPAGALYAHPSGNGASKYGITSELTDMGDYTVTRKWAEAFAAFGVNGLRYNSRFNPGAESWALFGPAGPAPALSVEPNSEVDGVNAVRAAGIAVLPPPPRKSAVRMLPGP